MSIDLTTQQQNKKSEHMDSYLKDKIRRNQFMQMVMREGESKDPVHNS